jgi:biopolymer transport protein ExbD
VRSALGARAAALSALSFALALGVAGCGSGLTCGPGTVARGETCEVDRAVCGPGGVYDANARMCSLHIESIPMDLPEPEPDVPPETITVTLAHDGALSLDGEPLDLAAFTERITAYGAASPNVRAVISADGRVAHLEVVRVIDLLRSANIQRFAIHVRPSELHEAVSESPP